MGMRKAIAFKETRMQNGNSIASAWDSGDSKSTV